MDQHLQGKVVLVTGASSGIGRECARLFAREGACLALAARRLPRLQSLVEEITVSRGEAAVFQTDLNQPEAPEALSRAVLDRFGRVDVLVNNAGFGRLDWLDMLDPMLDIDAQLRVNLIAPILLTRQLLPQMIARGNGSIINIASLASYVPLPMYTIYTSSKFGLRGFTVGLRRELRPKGINVMGIYPGFVETEFIEHIGRLASKGSRTPRFMWLSAEEVAWQVVQAAWRPRKSVIMPWYLGFGLAIDAVFPGLTDIFLQWYFSKRIDLDRENSRQS